MLRVGHGQTNTINPIHSPNPYIMRHNKFDLNLLVALDALLEECSVSRAAERVFLTQSAMSNALGRLRLHFQDDLVTQVGRRMVRTQKGEAIRGEVRSLLLRVAQVTRPVSTFDPATATRTYRIAASDYFVAVVLPSLLQRLESVAPSVRLEVQTISPNLNEDIERGEIDLLIVPHVYVVKGYPSRMLFEDDWVCVAWENNVRIGRRLSLDRFLELDHVVRRQSHPNFLPIDTRDIAQQNLKRKVSASLPQYGLLPLAVVGTQRIATVQRRLANLSVRRLPLKIHKCPFPCTPLRETMQWHGIYEADTGHQWLRELIAQVCDSPAA